MTTIRIQALPKFPASVEAGDGIIISRVGNVFTFAVDPAFIPAVDPTLTAIALLPTAADKLPYFTGADAAALADFSAFGRSLVDDANASAALTTLGVSSFVQTIADDADAAAVRATLGLGTSAVVDTGTSGAKVPLLNGANTFSAVQIINAGAAAGLQLFSNGATTSSNVVIGRTGTDTQLGVAGVVDTFFTGTVVGDVALKAAGGGALWLGGSAGVGVKMSSAGALTFPQHTTGNLTVNGSGVLSASRGQLFGTTTNDSATAGNIGELIESEILVGSAVSQTTGTSVNITSISLTAGDWDVFGTYFTNMAGGTSATNFEAAIHTVSATLPTKPNKGAGILMNCSGTGQNYGIPVGQKRLSLSGTTTVYLVASANFSGSTLSGYGYLGARRVR